VELKETTGVITVMIPWTRTKILAVVRSLRLPMISGVSRPFIGGVGEFHLDGTKVSSNERRGKLRGSESSWTAARVKGWSGSFEGCGSFRR
jgi:hypothetical protein